MVTVAVVQEDTRIRPKTRIRTPRKMPVGFEKAKVWLWAFVRAVLIIGISYIILYPLLIKISIAIKDKVDIYNPTIVWIPQHFTLDNFKKVMEVMDYGQTLLNTLLLSGSITVLTTISCALAGYAFAKLKFKGSGILFGCVILTILVPPQTIMVPTYLHFKSFDPLGLVYLLTGKPGINILDTYWPFILTSATANGLKAGLFIFIFRQFFRGLPKEMEEAAFVDGAGIVKTFMRIMVPNALPAMVTVMLFSFVWQWNDSYFTTLFLTETSVLSSELITLPTNVAQQLAAQMGLSSGQIDPYYASMLANTGMLLAIAPLVIMYIFVQRYFVESVERTGLVG
jgi:multiple sugar transport system permease protein